MVSIALVNGHACASAYLAFCALHMTSHRQHRLEVSLNPSQGPIFLLEYVIKKLIQKNSEVLLSIPWPKECAIMIYYWKGNRKYTMPVWASTTSDLTRLDLATLIRWLHSCSLPIHVSLDILKLRVYCLSSSWDPGPPACGAFSEDPNGSDST